MASLKKFNILPSLVVFDLDYTLWPFWVDTHPTPPFTKKASGEIIDSENQPADAYPDSDAILKELNAAGVLIGVASRTMAIKPAKQLIDLHGWKDYFCNIQIFPSNKIAHFNGLKKATGMEFKDMLFFDDENRNIADVQTLGVTCMHAPDGMSWNVLEQGLRKFELSK